MFSDLGWDHLNPMLVSCQVVRSFGPGERSILLRRVLEEHPSESSNVEDNEAIARLLGDLGMDVDTQQTSTDQCLRAFLGFGPSFSDSTPSSVEEFLRSRLGWVPQESSDHDQFGMERYFSGRQSPLQDSERIR